MTASLWWALKNQMIQDQANIQQSNPANWVSEVQRTGPWVHTCYGREWETAIHCIVTVIYWTIVVNHMTSSIAIGCTKLQNDKMVNCHKYVRY